jgi:hypothetical protein
MGTETTPRLLGAPTTGADVVIVREGKNFKGRVLSDVLGTVGKRTLKTAFLQQCQRHRGPQRRASAETLLLGLPPLLNVVVQQS